MKHFYTLTLVMLCLFQVSQIQAHNDEAPSQSNTEVNVLSSVEINHIKEQLIEINKRLDVIEEKHDKKVKGDEFVSTLKLILVLGLCLYMLSVLITYQLTK